jgi:uncharacterized protein
MIDDIFVINPVAHAYNMDPGNEQPNIYSRWLFDALYSVHADWNPAGVTVTREMFYSDWPVETLAKTIFLETDVDLAAHHTLRLDSYYKDGQARHEKTLEAATKYPDRFLAYVGLDPTQGLEVCLEQLERQLADIPNAIGLKLYPHQVDPIRTWRMDDASLVFPLFERAQAAGIKTVAIHKAAPLGPVPIDPYMIGDDLGNAANAFPDLAFEIIHAGMAFTTETALAITRFPNVYANLEFTASLLIRTPRLFEQVIGEFLMWAGPEKIIYSDGNMLWHSQPFLERFVALELSEETVATYGVQLTKEMKALILGGNYARITGLDVEAAKARIADDAFVQEREQTGLQEPYSNWRADYEAGVSATEFHPDVASWLTTV